MSAELDPFADLPLELRLLVERIRAGAMDELIAGSPLPAEGEGRASAVLVVFTPAEDGSLAVLLIERAADMRAHAGQVAFPGGAVDAEDADHIATALREAQEEVGLDPASVQILTELKPLFIARTGFIVTPVLAWWPKPVPLYPVDAAEVARVDVVALSELTNPANRFLAMHPSGYAAPGFEAGAAAPGAEGGTEREPLFIWGFTAGVLDKLLQLGGWAVEWDREVLRALPDLRR